MTKLLDNIQETIIIVLLAPIIILPELAYFIGDRARDKVVDMVREVINE